jgi:hypothetical protein
MCQHRYVIEWRPSADYDQWVDIEEVPMDVGGRLPVDERLRGLALARVVAADYIRAYPARVHEIVINRFSCNGPLEEELFIVDGVDGVDNVDAEVLQMQRLARDNVRLRKKALSLYADVSGWRPRVILAAGLLTVKLPVSEDAGAAARAALRGEELPPEGS